jgi:tetratricopeptide (TPR) repeat protein
MDRSGIYVPAIILILGGLAFLNSLGNGFTFDDVAIVVNNPVIRSLSPGEIFTAPWWPGQLELGLFRPVTTFTYSLNYALHELEPYGYHLFNVMLHLLNGAMVFWIAFRILGHLPSACVTSLMFLLHPVQSEAVNGVVGRAELLSAFWVLFGWLLYIAASLSEPRRQKILYWCSLLSAFIACFCKELGVVLVGLIALYECLLRLKRGDGGSGWILTRVELSRLIPYLLVVVLFLIIRYEVVGAIFLPALPAIVDNPLAHASSLERVLTAVSILGKYATLIIYPMHLSADYSYNEIPVVSSVFDWGLLCGGLVTGAVILIVVMSVRRRIAPEFGFGLAFLCLALLPASNLLFPIGTLLGERLLYLPFTGFCFFCGVIYLAASRQVFPTWLPCVAASLLLLGLGIRTVLRNADWRDNLTLFQSAAQTSPNSAKVQFNLGNAYRDTGNIKLAVEHYDRALSIYAEYAEVHYNKGVLLQEHGQLKQATSAYSSALLADSLHAPSWINLGTLMGRSGQYQSAYVAFDRARRLKPENLDAKFNFGLAAQELKRYEEAVQVYQEILKRAPDHVGAANNLAELYKETGYAGESIAVYRKLLKSRPDAYQIAFNLGAMQEKMGKPEEAAGAYELASNSADEMGAFALYKMGELYLSTGNLGKAQDSLERFLKRWEGSATTRVRAEQLLESLTSR